MENNNKSLIPVNNSLAKIEKQIAIGEKLLSLRITNQERKKIKDLLIFLGSKNNFSINLLSHFYTFNIETIDKNMNNLDWVFLSSNHNINWSTQLIDKYKEKWCWDINVKMYSFGENVKDKDYSLDSSLKTKSISTNKSILWTTDDIEKFKNYIYWPDFSKIVKLDWNDEIVDKFKFNIGSLCSNIYFNWDEKNLEKYKTKNLHPLSLYGLATNPSIQWNIELIKKHLLHSNSCYYIFLNEGLIWSETFFEELLELYKNSLPEEDRKDKIRIAWEYLSKNKKFQWCEEFIEKNEMQLNWGYHWLNPKNSLSNNEGLAWNENFIEKYFQKWDWFYLSKNSKLPWSENFINKYIENWEWDNLSNNLGLPWSEKFIDEHIERWNWKKLSQNPNLPWSLDFFEKYSNKWDFNILLFNKGFYKIFESILDDTLVNKIISEISIKTIKQ